MEFKDKKLEDLIVTLPFADGTELECGVQSVFDVDGKTYVALQALGADKKPDLTKNIMLYEVQEDEEHNPVVAYIEDDGEYAKAVEKFTAMGKMAH